MDIYKLKLSIKICADMLQPRMMEVWEALTENNDSHPKWYRQDKFMQNGIVCKGLKQIVHPNDANVAYLPSFSNSS